MLRVNPQGLLVTIGDFGLYAAKLKGLRTPLFLESLHEAPSASPDALKAWVQQLTGTAQQHYAAAWCAVEPKGLVALKAELENPLQARDDPKVFERLLRDKAGLDLARTTALAINPHSGKPFAAPPLPKQVLLVAAPQASLEACQDGCLATGLYPERLEMATLARLGGLKHYLRLSQTTTPTLLIQMATDSLMLFVFHGDTLDNVRCVPEQGLGKLWQDIQHAHSLADTAQARQWALEAHTHSALARSAAVAALVRELQSFVSFYELQFATRIARCAFTPPCPALGWIGEELTQALGVERLQPDYKAWMQQLGLRWNPSLELDKPDGRLFDLIALAIDHDALA
jgi:hypothetical protein